MNAARRKKQGLTLEVAMGQASRLFKYFGRHVITGKALGGAEARLHGQGVPRMLQPWGETMLGLR